MNCSHEAGPWRTLFTTGGTMQRYHDWNSFSLQRNVSSWCNGNGCSQSGSFCRSAAPLTVKTNFSETVAENFFLSDRQSTRHHASSFILRCLPVQGWFKGHFTQPVRNLHNPRVCPKIVAPICGQTTCLPSPASRNRVPRWTRKSPPEAVCWCPTASWLSQQGILEQWDALCIVG